MANVGELSPDRVGSGIQYGDGTIRKLSSNKPEVSNNGNCGC